MMTSLKGKKIFITGASSQLGITLIDLLLKKNLLIFAATYSHEGKIKLKSKFQSELKSKKITLIPFDLSCSKNIEKINWNEINYLCDLAHPDYESLIASADMDQIEKYFLATITNRAALLKSALRGMMKQKFGRALFLSSTAAERVSSGQGFYSASKTAGEQLYKSAGIEMAKKGITTVILRAGYIDSGRGKVFNRKNQVEKKIPTRKILRTEDIAQTILFLLSDSAIQINSSIVTMDGGMNNSKGSFN